MLSADAAINWASQGEFVATVAGGVVLYTQGSEAPAGQPNQERGIALHAAQGKASLRAHKNIAKLAAKQSITLASNQADIGMTADKHLLATAAGAYLKIEGGNIELGAPGTIEFKAGKKELAGPASVQAERPHLPKAGDMPHWIEIDHRDPDNEPFAGQGYKIFFEGGSVVSGKLDDRGHARHENVPEKAIRTEYEFPEPLKDKPWEPWKTVIAAARRKLG